MVLGFFGTKPGGGGDGQVLQQQQMTRHRNFYHQTVCGWEVQVAYASWGLKKKNPKTIFCSASAASHTKQRRRRTGRGDVRVVWLIPRIIKGFKAIHLHVRG